MVRAGMSAQYSRMFFGDRLAPRFRALTMSLPTGQRGLDISFAPRQFIGNTVQPTRLTSEIILKGGAQMASRKLVDLSRYAILPFLLIVIGTLNLMIKGTALGRSVPEFYVFMVFFSIITIERIYSYGRAVSQRHMIWRDLISTAVQALILGSVTGAIFLPVLHFFPDTFLGRRFLFGLSNQLGPLWVQVAAVFLLSNLWQDWIHRFQHYNEFLWKLHGYHHGVTNIQASNDLVSNPLDYAFRNILGGLVLGIVGF